MLQFKCFRLEHGKFGDGSQHLAGKLSGTGLVLIDFLGDLKCILSTIESLSAKFFGQIAHFFIDQLFFKKSFLLVVQALFKDVDFGQEGFLVRVLSWQVNRIRVHTRVFKFLRKHLNLQFLSIELFVQFNDFLGELGDFRDLLAYNGLLSLTLLELEVDHADGLLLLTNFLLAVLEDIFLDVRLLVQDTKFIIPVNQLNTHVITRFTGVLILVNQIIHLFLKRVDNQIELVTLVNELSNRGESCSELDLLAVKLRSELVTSGVLLDLLLTDVNEVMVLLSALVLQDVNFILENLYTLFHLSEILTTRLDLADVLVSRVLDFFI